METDIAIIGAGVVGLALAAELATESREVCVLEKWDCFGRETSSRNSEVIHSGLYYEPQSLKARLCVEGNRLLYAACREWSVEVKPVGKFVVACEEAEVPRLEAIYENGQRSGAEGLEMWDQPAIQKKCPSIHAVRAIWAPQTGIFDSHQFMAALERQAEEKGALFAYQSEVVAVEKRAGGFRLLFQEEGHQEELESPVLINAAGLGAEAIAQMVGIDTGTAGYTLHPCKGEYFTVHPAGGRQIEQLVYPLPPLDGASVGLHLTPDMGGRLRLGPSAFYVDELDYSVNPASRRHFYEAARKYLPFLEEEQLEPDMAGIRPKLKGPGEPFRDFEMHHEKERDLPGLINLIGIESPGLTASLAIARHIRELMQAEGLL